MRGFALMQNARDLETAWRRSQHYLRHQDLIDALRSSIGLRNPSMYRGIGRFPFTEWPEEGPGWQGQPPVAPDPEPAARTFLLHALGEDTYDVKVPRAVLSELDQALAVLRAMTAPSAFELVELCDGIDRCAHSLGFDVGYWGGGNFSILCDAAVWPMWHPPTEDALPLLASFVAQLNDELLFPSRNLASRYRDWYATQSWAEEMPEEFHIIEVGALSPPEVG